MVERSTHDGSVVGSNPAKPSASLEFLFYFFMKPLFLTSTRPKHKYKTEKFFSGYLRTRKVSKFVSGSSKQFSNFKKMLVMKKFFMWYYNIKSWRLFFKIFKLPFLQKRYTFRYLLSLYHLLERNLLVLLVRTKFSFNLIESLAYVKNKFIYVNGYPMISLFTSTRVGDIIEVLKWQSQYITNYFYILFLTRKAARFYFRYFVPIKRLYYITKFCFKRFKTKFCNFLRYKLYYNWIFFKLILLNIIQKKQYILNTNPLEFVNIPFLEKQCKKSPMLLQKIQYKLFRKNRILKKKNLIRNFFKKIDKRAFLNQNTKFSILVKKYKKYIVFLDNNSWEINLSLLDKKLIYLNRSKQDSLNSQLLWTKYIKPFYKKTPIIYNSIMLKFKTIEKKFKIKLLKKRIKKKKVFKPAFRKNRGFFSSASKINQ
jgi:hypothetical protein